MQFNIAKQWYRPSLSFWMICCLPFSWLFRLMAGVRLHLFKRGWLKVNNFPVPVIVVGNLTVGGTGKTPFVIWLAQFLKSQGYQPGIVSRGVGGQAQKVPHSIHENDAAEVVGDEALLLHLKTKCPVVICINRSAAVAQLLQQSKCDVVISDDGLQHYRLGRNIEIAMVDAMRGFGNKQLLPAGPLREPISRLGGVNFIVINNGTTLLSKLNLPFIKDNKAIQTTMSLQCQLLNSIKNADNQFDLTSFPHKKIHAVAGIGNPDQFFATLKAAGFTIIPHVFGDHHLYKAQDIEFNDNLPIIMTEKDAVKCKTFASDLLWYLPISAVLTKEFQNMLLSLLEEENNNGKTKMDFKNTRTNINPYTRNRACNANNYSA